MVLTPPKRYRTLYPLPLPDKLELSPDPTQASLEYTEYCVSLYYLVMGLNERLGDIENELPYGPRHFIALLTQYYSIARQQQEALEEELDTRPSLQLLLHPAGSVVTLPNLQAKIKARLNKVLMLIQSITRLLGLPKEIESAPLVANISVRECRLWCELNTADFRQRLQSARGTAELLPIMNEVSNIILGDVAIVSDQVDQDEGVFKVHNAKEDTSIVSPYVYFVCTGMDKEGNKLHNLVHVGCTRERFPMWKPLQQHRDDARNDLIGQEAIDEWGKWREQLVKLGMATTDATFRLRENLMQGNTEELPEWAHELVTKKLRACSNHVGQSFQQVDWNTIIHMGCCMLCKTTISFEEIKEKDYRKEAKCANLHRKKHCPHSCAEVATSGICDFKTRSSHSEL
ncbi:unnamed protein product [Clonostachys byssicola]|uniref:Uncharacterized protein n=1 Tax=Clonostachys byssicola TaxID=160290 RepID=A0A9N9UGE3_9HYPO|nr:unnamed protein product [Clonostachys byssicola]